jgi:hypothetical protein
VTHPDAAFPLLIPRSPRNERKLTDIAVLLCGTGMLPVRRPALT